MTTYYVHEEREKPSWFARLFGAVDIEDGLSMETAFRDLGKAVDSCVGSSTTKLYVSRGWRDEINNPREHWFHEG